MNEVVNEYNENNKRIYHRNPWGEEYWWEYNKNNKLIHLKTYAGYEEWYKWRNNKRIKITKQEFKYIQYNIRIKEYNSRTKCSRFEIMDI